ncbi:MAG: response regulator, partial [Nitrospirota bacterium]|nr:response regulator [Nitrospirota bacterium]
MTQDSFPILVVDDEPEMRQLLQDTLEEEHYRVVVASDGQEALTHMESEKFLVILTDLRMKGMDGLGLLEQVVQKYPESNLIMMTAFGTVES